MKQKAEWVSYPIFCPNCGQRNEGFMNPEHKIRYSCSRCGLVFVRMCKRRTHTLEFNIPEEQDGEE